MGKMSRDKGARVEREIVKLHTDNGTHAEKFPLSGAVKYQGKGHDIDVYVFGKEEAPLISEVKARKTGDGFKTLSGWLADNDILFLKQNHAQPLVVLPFRTWASIIKRVK